MNDARPQRPTPGPTAAIFHRARMAIDDAMHAGDPVLASRILAETAWELRRHEDVWGRDRPSLGVHRRRNEAA